MLSQSISVAGVSHRTASLAERERFALSREAARRLLADHDGESLLLMTCNRTELYADGPPGPLADLLTSASNDGDRGALFHLEDAAAVRHLFEVAAGLDSMVVGEPHILGQVKRSMAEARAAGTIGPVLDEMARRALSVGRRVRRETDLGHGMPSIPRVAADLARLVLGDLAGARVLVVGSGKMGGMTADTFRRAGVGTVAVTNRSPDRARHVADAVGGVAVGFERLDEELAGSDIVITCTASRTPVLTRDRIASAVADRAERPLVVIDIAVPRDVAADARGVAGARLYDLDDLRGWSSAAIEPATIDAARAIVDHETRAFEKWSAGRAAVPTIRDLGARAESILDAEVARGSASDVDELRAFGRRIVRKLLHHPITRMRDRTADEGEQYVAVVRDLFGLDEGNGDR